MSTFKKGPMLSRRQTLAGIAAGAVAATFPAPAISQGATQITMTLPWLPQGSQLFAFVARHRGMWRDRGLEVDIVRGFGSIPALQTIMQGQNQVGIIAAPTIVMSASQGVATRVRGVIGYDTTMGILVLDDSPVRTVKDLEGRKLGVNPGGPELAFLDTFLERNGTDPAKITRVALQPNVVESTLLNRQVDAIMAFATSNMPNILAQDIKVRFFPYSGAGLTTYSNCLTTTPEYLEANRSIVEAWVDGLCEATKFCMFNLEDAVDDFLSEVPEMKMTSTGETFTRFGAGLFLATLLRPELRDHGIGWADLASLNMQTDLIMQFLATEGSKRPEIESIFSNEMVGKEKLTQEEWNMARKTAEPYAAVLDFEI